VVPSALSQCVTVKFLTDGNLKLAEILTRPRAHFGDVSSTQVYDWSESLKENRTGVENMRRLRFLQGKLRPTFFGTLKAYY
jgi:hypothetical protein